MYFPQMVSLIIAGGMTAQAQQPEWDFSFPSTVSPSRSPTGTVIVSFHDLGANTDGRGDYEFMFVEGLQSWRALLSKDRLPAPGPVDGNFFVNDYIGSNVSDCLVAQSRSGQFSLMSLTQLLASQGANSAPVGHGSIFESPNNSHFYLTCLRWIGNDAIDVSVRGYTDETRESIREFAYSFRYSRRSGTLERVR